MKDRALVVYARFSLLAAVVCGVLSPAMGQAQFVTPRSATPQVLNVFLPAPRGLRQHLTRAEKARDEDRLSDAVVELGALLTPSQLNEGDGEAQDYFIGSRGDSGTQTSLKAAAQQLLGSLPPKALELYELQFGANARSLLDEALSEGNVGKLNEVTRRFFHTQAGYEAALLAGRHHLDHGRPLAAALAFKRVADTRAAAKYEPELSLLLATCWLYAKMPDHARQTLVELKKAYPNARLRMGAKDEGLFNNDAQALKWISSIVGAQGRVQSMERTDWPMYRGNTARNARSAGSLPVLNFRWQVPTANDPSDESLVRKRTKENLTKELPAQPGLHPLAVNDTILMRTPTRLVAVDFRSGKRIWEFPWFQSQDDDSMRARGRGQSGADNARLSQLEQRLWEDAVYGQMSSDGQSAFVIYELGNAYPNGNTPPFLIAPGGQRMQNPGWPKPYNKLAALDMSKEGKLRWIVGGDNGQDEPELAGAFFLGPPLPLMGQLYAMAEVKGEIRLVVLDAKTGRLQWQQQLAHVDTRTILVDGQRRLAGATPSFADGVLLCPTSAGAVVALDASNRALLWGYQYESTRLATPQFGFQRTYGQPRKPADQRWSDATVTISRGCAIVTPVETDQLHCLDLLTGQPRWPAAKRDGGLYVACVHDDKIIVVGKSKVTALRLDDGQAAWAQPVELSDEMPSGRGFYSENAYFLPTTAARLLKIDLDTGRVAATTDTGRVLGNLLCYQDEIISQGVDWLATYYQSKQLRTLVADRLRTNPQDPWALTRQGELLLQDGKRTEALKVLRQAYQLNGRDESTRTLLVTTLLAAIREDFAANRAVAQEAEQLIVQPAQRAEFLRLMAAGLQQNGAFGEAFDAYLKLATLQTLNTRLLGGVTSREPTMEEISRSHRVRRESWVEARLDELMSAADETQRNAMDAIVQQYFDEAQAVDTVQGWRRFVRFFGTHPLVARARLQLAAWLIQLDELLEAEVVLDPVRSSDDPQRAAAAAALTAMLLREAQHFDASAKWYRQLEQRWPDVVCHNGQSGRELAEQARERAELARAMDATPRWPEGKTVVEDAGPRIDPYGSYPRIYPVELQSVRGAFPQSGSVAYDQRLHAVIIRNGLGHELKRVPLGGNGRRFYSSNYSITRARALGNLLIVSIGNEIVAIDLLQNANDSTDVILWRRASDQTISRSYRSTQQLRPRGVASPWGEMRYEAVDSAGKRIGVLGPVTPAGVIYQQHGEVVCADPLTGEEIWAHGGMVPGSELFGDDQHVFVVAPKSEEARVLSIRDGREVGQRDVAEADKRWTSLGQRELSWKQVNERLDLRLRDAWEQRDIWRREFPYGSKGCRVEQDEVAVLQPDGKFLVLSLQDGQTRIETKLEPQQLSSIHVFRSEQRYMLVTNSPTAEPSNVNTVSLGVHVPLVSGYVYAFDRKTGRAQWPVPAVVNRYGLPLDQPREVPVLTFLRHVNKRQRSSPSTVTLTSALCLDKRDGRVALQKDEIPAQTQAYEVVGDRHKNEVVLLLQNRGFTMRFTDEPVPPAPPAQIGQAPASPDASAKGFVAQALFDRLKVQKPVLPPVLLPAPLPVPPGRR